MDALKDLRPAHLPTKPSFWPPSVGLLLVVFLVATIVSFLTYWFIKKRKARLKPKLLREFSLLSSSYEKHHSGEKLTADIAIMLRSAILWQKKDSTLLGKELSSLEEVLKNIFAKQDALEEVLVMLEKDRFKKVSTIDPQQLLLKTKELIASCRR